MPKAKVLLVRFNNVDAAKIILAHYASKVPQRVVELGDTDATLPQTYLPSSVIEDEDVPVTELLHEKSKRVYYFLDARKNRNKYWPNMIDTTNTGPLPALTSKPCRWCRHPFDSRPIGCPMRYHQHKKEGVERERFEEKLRAANLPTTTNDFFETEGMFCSFPCCKAYILDQRGSPRYKESLGLLTLLYQLYHGDAIPGFPPAPTWKILKDYGGHLSIQEFRSTFGRLAYVETPNVRRPYMYSSSHFIAENRLRLFSKPVGLA